MPELPEVETVIRELRSKISGHKILDIETDLSKILKKISLEKLKKYTVGFVIGKIERHGKYIIINLSNDKSIIIHLRMTGALLVTSYPLVEKRTTDKCSKINLENINPKHVHLSFTLDKNKFLSLYDIRKFATLNLFSQKEKSLFFKGKGIDALNKKFDHKKLKELLQNNDKNVKKILLDQNIISGIGNIYASEILFSSKINPLRKGKDLKDKEIKTLAKEVKKILKSSISLGGTTFSDFKNTEGKNGNYLRKLQVYRKINCKICKKKVKKVTIDGRSTFYCNKCQK